MSRLRCCWCLLLLVSVVVGVCCCWCLLLLVFVAVGVCCCWCLLLLVLLSLQMERVQKEAKPMLRAYDKNLSC